MMNLTPEAFYRQRDGRTDLASPNTAYQRVPTALIADPTWATTPQGQVAILTAANILSRWCRTVTLDIPPAPLVEPLKGRARNLVELVLETMRDADPFGTFTPGTANGDALALHLGLNGPCQSNTYHAYGSDWHATVATRPITQLTALDARNPIGAIGAACLGTASLFMHAVGQERYWDDPLTINFFSLISGPDAQTPFPEEISLGRSLLVGAGAVGSNLAYFLTLVPTVGRIAVIDHDPVKILNLNRSLLLTNCDVRQNKANVTARLLQRHGVDATPFPQSYDEFIASEAATIWEKPDLIIPAANEQDVRWKLATTYPPLMIYGTTDNDWGAHLGRHIPLKEECLACRYPPEFQPAALACATGPMPDAQPHEPDAALPFLSPLAALLALAELSKVQLPGYPFHGNRAFIDIAGRPQQIAPVHAEELVGCGACASRRGEVFSRFHRDRRWTSLSAP